MNRHEGPSFSDQRMICIALVFGIAMYAIVVGVILKMNEGIGLSDEPIEVLDTVALAVGITVAVVALLIRWIFIKKAEATAKEDRARPRLLSRIIPLTIIEGGGLLAITIWMLNGNAVPSLAVACVLLSLAIALIPLTDPDANAV